MILYVGIKENGEFKKLSDVKDLPLYDFSFELGYKIYKE